MAAQKGIAKWLSCGWLVTKWGYAHSYMGRDDEGIAGYISSKEIVVPKPKKSGLMYMKIGSPKNFIFPAQVRVYCDPPICITSFNRLKDF